MTMPTSTLAAGRVRVPAIVTVLLLSLASSDIDTALGQRFQPPPRRPQLEGNWIKNQTVPNPNYGRPLSNGSSQNDYRETITKQRVDGDAVMRDIGRALRYDIESWNYRNQQRQQSIPSRPTVVPAGPQYLPSQPQIIERTTRPATVVEPTSPPKNAVPAVVPKANADFSLTVVRAVRENGSSKTDAGQVLIAQDSIQETNASIGKAIEMSGDAAMKTAWEAAQRDGSAKALADFEEKFGDKLAALDPTAANHLGLSIKFSSLGGNLKDGLLTSEGKRKALEDLMADVAALPANDPLRAELVDDLKRMKQLQQIGELMDLASLESQPLVPIWEGLDAADIPIESFTTFLGLPVMDSPATGMEATTLDAGIRLVNPESTGAEVRFSIGGKPEKMAAGSEIALSASSSVIFDPGNGQYRGVSVSPGTWEWQRESGLWNLRQMKPEITLENPGFDGVFHYTVNGRQAALKRGESVKHADSVPLRIAFDRGDGGTPVTKVFSKGVYVVAIDADSKWLDLFRTDVAAASNDAVSPTAADDESAASKGAEVQKALADPERRRKMNALIESLRIR